VLEGVALKLPTAEQLIVRAHDPGRSIGLQLLRQGDMQAHMEKRIHPGSARIAFRSECAFRVAEQCMLFRVALYHTGEHLFQGLHGFATAHLTPHAEKMRPDLITRFGEHLPIRLFRLDTPTILKPGVSQR